MAASSGVIGSERNPFATPSWGAQGQSLSTAHRQGRLERLFGKSLGEIRSFDPNEGQYPAFLGIRWGFARLEGDRLSPTDKWENRPAYDGFGEEITVRPKETSVADSGSPSVSGEGESGPVSSEMVEFSLA